MKKLFLFACFTLATVLVNNTLMAQGCVETTSSDGPQLVGYIQPQFNYYMFGDDALGNPIKPSTFEFLRARVGIVGSIPYDISYYVMAELSPVSGGPSLLDAYISYAPFDKYLKFSIGQFKSPFSLELNTPCYALNTINRSTVVNNLASPFRDMGLMLLGSFGKERDIISYKLAVLNGTGINTLDDNGNKEIAARVVYSPFEWIKIGASGRTGLIGKIQDSVGNVNSVTRYAGDLTLDYKKFKFQGEYIYGITAGTVATGGSCGSKSTTASPTIYKSSGFWVAAMYTFNFNLQPVIKYESYDPDGTTYSYQGVAQNYGENTFTFGINYFLNDWTRVQVNYLYNSESKIDGKINEYDNDAVMVQFQVNF
ncbi:MAG: porin [Bacteroidales bacterium]|jgi:phosphate-selective porin